MTAKEKAQELIKSFTPYSNTVNGDMNWIKAKHSALIAVDELITSFAQYTGMYDQEFFDSEKKYWQEVKSEIEKL